MKERKAKQINSKTSIDALNMELFKTKNSKSKHFPAEQSWIPDAQTRGSVPLKVLKEHLFRMLLNCGF